MRLRSLLSTPRILAIALTCGVAGWLALHTTALAQEAPKGTAKIIQVHGKSLEGNLNGDPAERDVYIYLPPSYDSQPNKRYPVVYFLHGFGASSQAYWNLMSVPETADRLMTAGTIQEMILVHPDANTKFGGSFYSNSATTGYWEDYITNDLIAYIDSHYRTIATREGRGLAGHSMGGYGAFRIGIKHSDLYSVLYPMSACCLLNNPYTAGQGGRGAAQAKGEAQAKAGNAAKGKGKARPSNGPAATAAAWSPDPHNPPDYYDEPTENGQVRPEIAAKWLANAPMAFVDQYVPGLKSYRAFKFDVGLSDSLLDINRQMDQMLTELGIAHEFETYEGGHGDKVKPRFASNILPFFSENLNKQ